MNAFVASPQPPASPEASAVDAGGNFWPDVDVGAARAALRLGDSMVTHERLVAAIEGAMIAVMGDLLTWAARQVEAGFAALDQVDPLLTVNGEKVAVALWNRAVRYAAAAELADAYTDLAATNEGVTRAQDKRSIADDYRRISTVAQGRLAMMGVADPAGPSRAGGVTVDLV